MYFWTSFAFLDSIMYILNTFAGLKRNRKKTSNAIVSNSHALENIPSFEFTYGLIRARCIVHAIWKQFADIFPEIEIKAYFGRLTHRQETAILRTNFAKNTFFKKIIGECV